MVREHYEEAGRLLMRIGLPPKRAFLFRTDEPFKKITINFTVRDGAKAEKLELLCDGQQVVVDGIHPDTRQPYRWFGGSPDRVPRDELPYICEAEARELMERAAKLLVDEFYYVRAADRPPRQRVGDDTTRGNGVADWSFLTEQIYVGNALHDSLLALAGKLVISGMSGGAAVNFLRGLMNNSTTPRDARWQERYDEIPKHVESAMRFPDGPDRRAARMARNIETGDIAVNSVGSGLDDAEVGRLARLPFLEYDRQRTEAAETLGVRMSVLDRMVCAERDKLGLDDDDDSKQGRAISFPATEPWPEAVDGVELLEELADAIRGHVVLSDTARDSTVLWVVLTYLTDVFVISPRLAVTSPVKRSGKTTHLDVLGRLVQRPLSTANVSSAAVFRVIEKFAATLLVDEADTFFGDNNELRGVLNSGHRKGGQVLRVHGDDHEPRAFSTYGACAIALIGLLPDTLNDRSIRVDLKRRLKTEPIKPFRIDRVSHLDVLARKVARWTSDNAGRIGMIDPTLPDAIINREADNWRPLLAIAEAAGGDWPKRAREAVEAAHAAAGDADASLVEALRGDIKTVFAERDQIKSDELVTALVGMQGHPWAEMGKARKPLTANRLARLLRPLGIAPGDITVENGSLTGTSKPCLTTPSLVFARKGG